MRFTLKDYQSDAVTEILQTLRFAGHRPRTGVINRSNS